MEKNVIFTLGVLKFKFRRQAVFKVIIFSVKVYEINYLRDARGNSFILLFNRKAQDNDQTHKSPTITLATTYCL
jgi:hypothetical protein